MKIKKRDLVILIESYLHEQSPSISNTRFTVTKSDFKQFIELIFNSKKTGLHQKMINAASDFGAPFNQFAALMYDGMEAEDDWQQKAAEIAAAIGLYTITSHGIGQLTWKAGAKMVKAHLADNTWEETSEKFGKYVKNEDDKSYLAIMNRRGKGPVKLETDEDSENFGMQSSRIIPEISSKKILDIIEGLSDDMNLAVSAAYLASNPGYEEYVGASSGLSEARKNRLEFIEKNVEKLSQYETMEAIQNSEEFEFFFT